MGPEIAENRKGNIDPLCPRLETGEVVCKHTQDLGVVLREEVLELLVRGKLPRSDRCERGRHEAEQHVLFSPVVTEGYPGVIHARQGKIRGLLPHLRFVGGLGIRYPDI